MRKRIVAGAGVSIGAVLAAPSAAQADDFTVTNLNDSGAGSLREAVEDSNDNPGADRVLFQSKLSGTIATGGSALPLDDSVQVLGPGARNLTVSGGGDSRVFDIFPDPGQDVSISGLTITDGEASYGGGLTSSSTDLTLADAVIAGNTAGTDAAIFADGGSVTLLRSTVSGNDAGGSSGGIGVDNLDLLVESSTISGNTADSEGGGMYIDDSESVIRNSTVSGNSAGGDGGGIWAPDGALTVASTTIADNQADNGGGVATGIGTVTLRGSIVADNGPEDLYDGGAAAWFGAFSLVEDPGNTGITSSGGNLIGVDPALKPLANNGGPTDTHAFKKSPAKNKGPSDAPDKDQRGAPRKGQADIGAYEFSKCKGVVVNFVGTSGKDKLKGTKRKDGMLGLGGNDKLKGKKGKDGLCGGRGKDKLIGGPGKDKFNGGPGKDKEVQ